MSRPASGPIPDHVLDEAVRRLVCVESDAATERDWIELTAWLEASPMHLAAYERAEALSSDVDDMVMGDRVEVPPRPTAQTIPLPSRRLASRRPVSRRSAWAPLAAGAAAAAAVVLVAWPTVQTMWDGRPVIYRTELGETRRVELADGSRIDLDAQSVMTVRLGLRLRRVTLGQAQAAFDVAKDVRRPFVIAVDDQEVRVVGTQFNIRHFGDTTDVTVRRGVVEVRPSAPITAPAVRLTVGERLSHVAGTTASRPTRVDPDGAFAWASGRLVCDDERLADLVADLNRRYAKPIRLAPGVGEKRFTGVLELGDQTTLVRRLTAYVSLPSRSTAKAIVIG